MSTFKSDLDQEHLLSQYLDGIYKSKDLAFERIHDLNRQHQGMDLIFKVNLQDYIIDEKAQLHYLNKDLPTFTFELSYLKEGNIHQGWLFDDKKITDHYFLNTGILLKKNKTVLANTNDIETLKITSVNRHRLILHLESIGLSKSRLIGYDLDLRTNHTYGKNPIPEFRNPKDGCLFYTEHLAEKPINLQLSLKYMVSLKIAKRLNY